MAEAGWTPDGKGLPTIVQEILDRDGGTVHLRLSDGSDAYPRLGCAGGVGQWWTGKASEVNCPACLELTAVFLTSPGQCLDCFDGEGVCGPCPAAPEPLDERLLPGAQP